MWVRQGDRGELLFARMSQPQRTKEEVTKEGRHREDESRDLIANDDKAYDGAHQRDRKTGYIKEENQG